MHSPGILDGDMPTCGWKYDELPGKIPQAPEAEVN